MDIQEKLQENYAILHVEGDFLCEDEKPVLKDTITRLLSRGLKYIILDLSRVHHMNSCGLGSLVAAMTTMRKSGGDFVLLSPSENIDYLLSITKLNQIFSIYKSADHAIKNFR